MSRDPKSPPPAPQDLFPCDEMSTGEASSMLRRANVLTGATDRQQPPKDQPPLKPMTGAQLAFRPNAPPRPASGSQPAFKPTAGKTGTNQFAAFKPVPSEVEEPGEQAEEEFDPEKLQTQIRAMSMSDSALGRAGVKSQKPSKATSSSADDTFVKTKMKQAEAKVPDFDLDEDLG